MHTTSIDFKAINKAAEEAASSATNIITNLASLSTDVEPLAESVTHVLANIAATVHDSRPFTLMHVDSVSAFLAGVEVLAHALPHATDANKIANTLRVLTVISIKDGVVSPEAAPIARLGALHIESLAKYRHLVRQYVASVQSGHPHSDTLLKEVKHLQLMVDRAMTIAVNDNSEQITM